MHILFLGYSKLVQQRILPFISEINGIDKFDIAKHDNQKDDLSNLWGSSAEKLFDNFEDALKNSNADLVYISIINSAHFEWTQKALLNGYHVIVDKPAVGSYDEAVILTKLAKEKKLCIAESIVYLDHPQFKLIDSIIEESNSKPSRLSVAFSFPPLNKDNFRYVKDMGGGAIYDTAPYFTSIVKKYFKDFPENINCYVNAYSNDKQVETSYSIIASFKGGRSAIGHFGFDTEYVNKIGILGPNLSIDFDRVFTSNPDMENEIRVKINNEGKRYFANKGNSFAIFIDKIITTITHKKITRYYADLEYNAKFIEQIKNNN